MTATPRHAPVPADQCGNPLACPQLIPEGAQLADELRLPDDRMSESYDLFDSLFGPLGLPTGRLVCKPGMWLFVSDNGRSWLAVDYLVPGTRTRGRSDGTLGWDVQLNSELGRGIGGAKTDAARDRWIVELEEPLPEWLIRHRPADSDTEQQTADHG